MAQLDVETRKQINIFYDEKFRKLNKELEILESKIRNEKIEEFNQDKDVIKCKELIKKIQQKFSDYSSLRLYCDGNIYSSEINYFDNKDYKQLHEEKNKLLTERRNLFLTLENNIKNSKEYKQAINDFIKKAGE